MGEDPAHSWDKAVYAPDDLTTIDAVILDRYFNYGLVQIHRLQEMDDMGMAHEGSQTHTFSICLSHGIALTSSLPDSAKFTCWIYGHRHEITLLYQLVT